MDLATHQKQFKPIKIKDLFMDKSPTPAPWIPGFVYRFLSRMLRIDFMNQFLYEHGLKKNVDFARASIDLFNVTPDVKGTANLPEKGRFMFVASHPLRGFDGMMIISELLKKYQNLKVLVNDLLMNVKNMDGIFVPINRHESYKHRNKHFVITFGKPIPFSTFENTHNPKEWAGMVKEHTYSLADNPESEFNPNKS